MHFTYGLTPLENSQFCDLSKMHILQPRRFIFYLERPQTSFLGLFNFTQNNIYEIENFDQNHELTPLANIQFSDKVKCMISLSRKVSFSSRTSQNIIPEMKNFDQKHGLISSEKSNLVT